MYGAARIAKCNNPFKFSKNLCAEDTPKVIPKTSKNYFFDLFML